MKEETINDLNRKIKEEDSRISDDVIVWNLEGFTAYNCKTILDVHEYLKPLAKHR